MALNHLSPPRFRAPSPWNGSQKLENVGIARAVNHWRAYDYGIRRQHAHQPLGFQVRFAVVRQRAWLGVLIHRRAVCAGTDGRQRAHMHQAYAAPRQSAHQRFRGTHVTRVVIAGRQRLGDARQVNHGIGAADRLLHALAADEIAVGGFDPAGRHAGEPCGATGSARALPARTVSPAGGSR